MKEIKIEHLAYLLKQAKEKKQPQPIFFLGAGASRSGNIPSAGEIIEQILKDYSNSPFVQDLPIESRTYSKLMDCLLPDQRDELLKKYIDEAKINVTHIYLAQLLKEEFVDYVLTVNFDNLMLRALALFNIFPSTYDMAILKDLTTTSFKEKSVVYLHGQNHGLWLLNTPEEMEKVKNTIPRIFDSIKNKRPWIFIGYSGEDPIFEHVKNLGRFNNGLYWITYNDHDPNENIQKFLSAPNTNAFVVKGYDSDSFMLKLNTELKLAQPSIIDNPFTALKDMLNEIVDIEENETFKGVKERLEISKRQVQEAINQHELGIVESTQDLKEVAEIDILKKEIINLIITDKYEEKNILAIEEKVKNIDNKKLKRDLSNLYYSWGNYLGDLVKTKEGNESDKLYHQLFEKFQLSIEIDPQMYLAYNSWGSYLGDFAITKVGNEKDELYYQSFDKYQKAIEIKPDYDSAYYNWGTQLAELAITKAGKEADVLFSKSFEKFEQAIKINPRNYKVYNNWGAHLGTLAKTKVGKEADSLYNQCFEKFQKLIEIKPDFHQAYANWGIHLRNYAKTKAGNEAEKLLNKCLEIYKKEYEYGGDCYNLACYYAQKEQKEDALRFLNISLINKEISVQFVEKDEDWQKYLQDSNFKSILKIHQK